MRFDLAVPSVPVAQVNDTRQGMSLAVVAVIGCDQATLEYQRGRVTKGIEQMMIKVDRQRARGALSGQPSKAIDRAGPQAEARCSEGPGLVLRSLASVSWGIRSGSALVQLTCPRSNSAVNAQPRTQKHTEGKEKPALRRVFGHLPMV
jgi:hypothetical protein